MINKCQKLLRENGTIWISGTFHIIYSIAFAAQKLDMKFLGFANLSPTTMKSFNNLFPGTDTNQDLLHWHIFEQENPHTFIAMYQFWCQAID